MANYLQAKAIDVSLITIFKTSLQTYLKLAKIGMMRNNLIEHKEATMICEESGPSHSKCRNPNIGFVTKCEVQRPMRPKMCLSVKHTLTNGGECKG